MRHKIKQNSIVFGSQDMHHANMPIVTLISDLGTKDYYVAAVKGAILSQCPSATLVDITHQIQAFDLFQTAYNVKNVYPDFPVGTIHLIGIEPEQAPDSTYLIAKHEGQYFVACNNGVLSLIFDEIPQEMVEIAVDAYEQAIHFPTRDILGKTAGQLASGTAMNQLGKATSEYKRYTQFNPIPSKNAIQGMVNYIDNFGNVFTNISIKLFESVGNNRPFSIFFAGLKNPIRKVSKHYHEVSEGEKIALFSASGHLQLAINKGALGVGGGASQLLGLKLGHTIRIDFENTAGNE